MDRAELREFWINYPGTDALCMMADGRGPNPSV